MAEKAAGLRGAAEAAGGGCLGAGRPAAAPRATGGGAPSLCPAVRAGGAACGWCGGRPQPGEVRLAERGIEGLEDDGGGEV